MEEAGIHVPNIKKKIKGRLVPYRKTDQALVIDPIVKKERKAGTSWWSVAKSLCSQCRGVGSIPGGEDYIPHTTIKTWHSHINKYFLIIKLLKKHRENY